MHEALIITVVSFIASDILIFTIVFILTSMHNRKIYEKMYASPNFVPEMIPLVPAYIETLDFSYTREDKDIRENHVELLSEISRCGLESQGSASSIRTFEHQDSSNILGSSNNEHETVSVESSYSSHDGHFLEKSLFPPGLWIPTNEKNYICSCPILQSHVDTKSDKSGGLFCAAAKEGGYNTKREDNMISSTVTESSDRHNLCTTACSKKSGQSQPLSKSDLEHKGQSPLLSNIDFENSGQSQTLSKSDFLNGGSQQSLSNGNFENSGQQSHSLSKSDTENSGQSHPLSNSESENKEQLQLSSKTIKNSEYANQNEVRKKLFISEKMYDSIKRNKLEQLRQHSNKHDDSRVSEDIPSSKNLVELKQTRFIHDHTPPPVTSETSAVNSIMSAVKSFVSSVFSSETDNEESETESFASVNSNKSFSELAENARKAATAAGTNAFDLEAQDPVSSSEESLDEVFPLHLSEWLADSSTYKPQTGSVPSVTPFKSAGKIRRYS